MRDGVEVSAQPVDFNRYHVDFRAGKDEEQHELVVVNRADLCLPVAQRDQCRVGVGAGGGRASGGRLLA